MPAIDPASIQGASGGLDLGALLSAILQGSQPGSASTIGGGNRLLSSGNAHDLYANSDHWTPYSQNGQTIWANPNAYNPVPNATVPGASVIPGTTYKNQASQAQAFTDLLPYLQSAANQQILPTALSNLQASAVTSPAYAQLMTSLYNQYGPLLNQIGNVISGQNMQAFNQNQLNALQNGGTQLLKAGYDASQIFDAPYYQARSQTANSLGNLLSSIDLSGNLGNNEISAINQGLAREGVQRGNLNSPDNATTVANATLYGNAAYQRKQQAQSTLSNAINAASSFLPQAKTGVNVFGTATGANAPTNTGNSLFTGINTNFGDTISNALFGQTGQTGQTAMNNSTAYQINEANIKANAKDWMDYLEQSSEIYKNIAGGSASMAAMCWVAREVYGADNPKWLQFRHYLLSNADPETVMTYLTHGREIAEYISDKPDVKNLIKRLMDSKL